MDTHHFAPARAAVADADPHDPAAPKPKSVLLLQGLLGVLGAGMAIKRVAAFIAEPSRLDSDGAVALMACVPPILVVTVLALTVMGCQRRRPDGRWLGAWWIAAMLAVVMLRGASGIRAGAQAGDTPEVVAQCVALSVPLAMIGFWLYRFGFSPRARAWFGAASVHPVSANELPATRGR